MHSIGGESIHPPSLGDSPVTKTSSFEDVSSKDVLPAVSTSGEKIRRPTKGEERVALRGLEADTPFFIRKMEVPKDENRIMAFFRSLLWAKVKEGDKTIYLNIGSIAKRYCMSRSEVSHLAKEGKLEGVLKERVTHLRPLAQIQKEAVITSSERRQVAVELLAKKTFSGPIPTPTLLINLSKEGKLSVYRLGDTTLIGQGSFGKVYTIPVATAPKGTMMAIKVGKKVLQEAENLQKLQERGVKAQEAPEASGILPSEEDPLGRKTGPREFMITPLFTAPKLKSPDLDAWTESKASGDKKQQKDCLRQLMGQYRQLVGSGMYHGDLKPQNIFVSEKDGNNVFKFGDWGDAQDLDHLKGIKAFTKAFLPYEMGMQILDQGDPEGARLAAKCHDRFATGCCLYSVLTGGQLPYELDEDGYPTGEFNEALLDEHGVSEDMKSLLIMMTSMEVPEDEERFQHQQDVIAHFWNEVEKQT